MPLIGTSVPSFSQKDLGRLLVVKGFLHVHSGPIHVPIHQFKVCIDCEAVVLPRAETDLLSSRSQVPITL